MKHGSNDGDPRLAAPVANARVIPFPTRRPAPNDVAAVAGPPARHAIPIRRPNPGPEELAAMLARARDGLHWFELTGRDGVSSRYYWDPDVRDSVRMILSLGCNGRVAGRFGHYP